MLPKSSLASEMDRVSVHFTLELCERTYRLILALHACYYHQTRHFLHCSL